MKKVFLLLSYILISFQIFGQKVFYDDQSGYTTANSAPDATKYVVQVGSSKPWTIDSTIDNTWEYTNYSDIGRGFYSSSRWTGTATGTANDFLMLKEPLPLATLNSPKLSFSYLTTAGNGILEIRAVTSVASASNPTMADFASSTLVWSSSTLNTSLNWVNSVDIDLSAVKSPNTYLVFINKSSDKLLMGIRNILVKGSISQDVTIVGTSFDSNLVKVDWNITNSFFKNYKLLNCGDSTQIVNVTFRNDGTAPITSFQFSVDMGTGPITDTLTGLNIAPGALYNYKFSKTAIYNYVLNVPICFTTLTGDINNIGDTTDPVIVILQAYPYDITSTDKFVNTFENSSQGTQIAGDLILNMQSRYLRGNTTDTNRVMQVRDFSDFSPADQALVVHGGTNSLSCFAYFNGSNFEAKSTNWWYISPCINFDATKSYYISYWANPLRAPSLDNLYSGSGQTISAMTNLISRDTLKSTDSVFRKITKTFKPTTSGPLNIGLNYVGSGFFFVDDFEIGILEKATVSVSAATDAPSNVDYDSLVTFTPNITGEGISSIVWDFGDPGSANNQITTTSTAPQTHKFSKPGTYTVTVTVTNAAGTTSTTVTVTVKGIDPPKADFTFVVTNSTKKVTFTNKSTPDVTSPAGAVLKYEWDFGNSSTINTTKSPTYTYTNAGTYNVCLKVTNDGGTDQVCKEVKITAPPTVSISNPNDINKFTIYPNPVKNGEITIESAQSGKMQVRVIDILGKQIQASELKNSGSNKLDVSGLSNGVYFLELETKQGKQIEKIIIDK